MRYRFKVQSSSYDNDKGKFTEVDQGSFAKRKDAIHEAIKIEHVPGTIVTVIKQRVVWQDFMDCNDDE